MLAPLALALSVLGAPLLVVDGNSDCCACAVMSIICLICSGYFAFPPPVPVVAGGAVGMVQPTAIETREHGRVCLGQRSLPARLLGRRERAAPGSVANKAAELVAEYESSGPKCQYSCANVRAACSEGRCQLVAQ